MLKVLVSLMVYLLYFKHVEALICVFNGGAFGARVIGIYGFFLYGCRCLTMLSQAELGNFTVISVFGRTSEELKGTYSEALPYSILDALRVSTRGMHIFGLDDARFRAYVGLFIELLFM